MTTLPTLLQSLTSRTDAERALTEPLVTDHVHGRYSITTTCGRHYSVAWRDDWNGTFYIKAQGADGKWREWDEIGGHDIDRLADEIESIDLDEASAAIKQIAGIDINGTFLALYDTNVPAAWAYAEQVLAGRIGRRAA
jgi:hypothetical protein